LATYLERNETTPAGQTSVWPGQEEVAAYWASGISSLTYLLSLPGSEQASDAAPISNRTRVINDTRRRAGFPPLPRVRVVNLDRTIHPSHTSTRGTGEPVRAHWRRAHMRTLADGRQVPIRAAAIHSGGDAPPHIRVMGD
jgi:hypothetical protein